jgi:AAA domain-containing protein
MTFWSAPDLLKQGFPDPVCIVEKILMEGFTLFAGRPKTGKSWVALCLALSIAAGVPALGSLKVTSGPVLYLALEDTPRRLQKRLRLLLGEQPAPPSLYIATAWPRGQAGADQIDKWAASQPGAALAIVDTLEKVRAKRSEKGNAYTEDYEAISMLKEKADKHALGLLALTHEKKGGADDMIEAATGSMGQAGTADQSWVLRRKRGETAGKLFVTGRDIEEITVNLDVEDKVHWKVSDVDEGHEGWETSTKVKAVKFRMDRSDELDAWCRERMNGHVELQLPTKSLLRQEVQFTPQELSDAFTVLRGRGQVITRAVKRERGMSSDFFIRNGE